ncbi:hypothetical protein Hanom_Chr15g01384481 [Helianthus anomalus]
MNKLAPLIVMTSELCGCTIGSPYSTHIPQFTNVARYGTGENCSTAPFFTILMNVGTGDKNKMRALSFPMIPTDV